MRGSVFVLTLVVVVAGCGSGRARVAVTAAGRIGPLHVDRSDRADVIAFAGKPESETHGRYSSYPAFDALGYGCKGKQATGLDGVPRCETVFYLDSRSGALALLYTEDARYEFRRVGVGVSTASAERLLAQKVTVGCLAALGVETKTGFVVLTFGGGNIIRSHPRLGLAGGQVEALVVHSKRLSPGVLDCIDG